MHIVLGLLHFLSVATVAFSAPGIISSPPDGSVIGPGASFTFEYDSRADYSVSSFNYTVWLFTSLPTSLAPADTFATGHFFGRFATPNYPANPNPPNTAPSSLVMPDFSKNPGGWGIGATAQNAPSYLAVLEEYATSSASLGLRIGMTMNRIVYNGTVPGP